MKAPFKALFIFIETSFSYKKQTPICLTIRILCKKRIL